MLDRLLFRLRTALGEPRVLLGSWKLSVALMVGAAVFYLLLTIYSWAVPTHVVSNIAGLWVFWIAWLLLFVNTFVCLWNRWRSTRASSILFHGSFVIVAAGVLLTTGGRSESKIRVAQGETFTGDVSQYASPASRTQPPPFTLVSITPEFWRDELLFTRLEAVLEMDGAKRITKINRPLWIGGASFLRLSGFGFAPRYELLDASGRVVESAFTKMNVFPPGSRDFLMPENYPYRIYLELYPDAEVRHGDMENRGMALRQPALVARVYRGHLPIAAGTLRPGETLAFEGLQLRFPEIRMWGELTWVRDPGVVVTFAGAIAGLAGLAMKLWRRA
jgi:hypothetical protein